MKKLYLVVLRKLRKSRKNDQLYYIKTQGYVGDAALWWRENSSGHTVNLVEAGKYSKAEAEQICREATTERAYKVSTILSIQEGHQLCFAGHYLPQADFGQPMLVPNKTQKLYDEFSKQTK